MSTPPRLVNGKINPKWFESVWKARASECERSNQKLAGEYLLDGCDLSLLENFNLDRYLKLVEVKQLENAKLSNLRVQADSISHSALNGCDFSAAIFHRSVSGTINLSGCDLRRAKGIWGDSKPIWGRGLSDYRQEPPILRHAVIDFRGVALPAWSSIRSIGNLPIFGVSNLALLSLLIYAGFGRWYNSQIAGILRSAGSHDEFLASAAANLQLAPKPWPFGMLFISLILLSIASGLFAIRCPDPVKDFSPVQWEVGKNQMLEYISANYDRPLSRWMCFFLYGMGGLIALPYAIYKSLLAIIFFFS